MHFQIFVPKKQGAMDLAGLGLEDLSVNANFQDLASGPTVIGPDGNPLPLGPGKLFTWDAMSATYYGDSADWVPALQGTASDGKELASGRFYLGVRKNSPPAPEELLRVPNPKYSLPVTDEEGRVWLIPVARRFPVVIRRLADGSFEQETHAKYRDYFDRAGRFWSVFVDGGSVPYEEWWDFCQFALSKNYRMPQELMSHLGVLTQQVMEQIPRAALDLDELKREMELREENQKKAAGG